MHSVTDPDTGQQFSLALGDPGLETDPSSVQLSPAVARLVADSVEDLVAEVLSGKIRHRPPEYWSGAFLQDVLRIAAEEEVELTEEDCIQLLNEAATLEVSLRTAEHIHDSLDTLLGSGLGPEATFTFRTAGFLDQGAP